MSLLEHPSHACRVLFLATAANVAIGLATPAASRAQMVYVEFKDEKVARKYRKHLTDWHGRQVLVGEAKAGLTLDAQGILHTSGAEARNELWVGDAADPAKAPYRTVAGERSKATGGDVVSFPGDDVRAVGYVDRFLSLEGLAREYQRRRAELEQVQEERDRFDRKTRDWMLTHARYLSALERTGTWLRGMGYGAAADKIDKEVEKQRKVVAAEASEARYAAAVASIGPVEVPAELVAASQAITAGQTVFRAQQSQHLRIYYADTLADATVTAALALGEKVLEGFRREFVDPYLGDDYQDPIPEGLVLEHCLVPDDRAVYERFWAEYYGRIWGKDKERMLDAGGTHAFLRKPPCYVGCWKLRDQFDLGGVVTHDLGHAVTDLHYNDRRGGSAPAWLTEALSYYLSFGYLGRNTVTCFAIDPAAYGAERPQEGEKTVQLGMRDHFNGVALEQGPALDALAIKTLAQIADPDFAKAWSLFDWIAREQGKQGQLWLRSMCKAHATPGSFLQRWREITEQSFGVEPGTDVFAALDARWREYARTQQVSDQWTK